MLSPRNSFMAVVLGLALTASPLLAQNEAPRRGIDPFLPPDTEIISTVNFKQIFDSNLFKKYMLEEAREALKNAAMVKDILDDLGFDPFKDLDKVISAGPGGSETDKGLIIVHGRFNVEKFKAKAEDAAKSNSDNLKVHKINDGKNTLYEVTVDPVPTLWVALASKTTLLVSPGKDYVVDALKRVDKPVRLQNKDFQSLLEKMDNRQSVSLAAVGKAVAKADLPEAVKEAFENIDAIGGGLTIGEDINFELVGNAKTAKDAKDINDKISAGLNFGLGLLGIAAGQNKELAPLVDIAKTVRSSARDKTVTIKAAISAELIEKARRKE